ncbi:MAG: hypothetical protein JXR38_00320 [Bacilli bacterium]|nr:hypothetical protein [Bacilli bacterium]
MDLVKTVCRIYMLFMGLFFITISLDVFNCVVFSFWENFGSFALHCIPGFLIIILTLVFWKREVLLGMIAFAFALAFFAYAKDYDQFLEQYSLVLMVEVPMVLAGAILVLWGKRPEKKH